MEEAYRLGTRLSINIETPTPEMLARISPMKDMRRDILEPMSWVDDMMRRNDRRAGGPAEGAVGQATQMVVGAADESDWDIFQRMDQLYSDWNFKRVYYSPFQPVRHTPLEEHPATPMIREHRLYQVDWLKRVYAFDNDELRHAYDGSGFLPHEDDPKTSIALANLDRFPVDVNEASRERLLRVPGVGPKSAGRNPAQPHPPLRGQLARPPGDGSGAQVGVALPGASGSPAADGQAVTNGPLRRAGTGGAQAEFCRATGG